VLSGWLKKVLPFLQPIGSEAKVLVAHFSARHNLHVHHGDLCFSKYIKFIVELVLVVLLLVERVVNFLDFSSQVAFSLSLIVGIKKL